MSRYTTVESVTNNQSRHDEEETVDGVDDESFALSDEESMNKELNPEKNNNIPEISNESGVTKKSLEEQDYEYSSDEHSDESDVEIQEQVREDTVHDKNSVFEDISHPSPLFLQKRSYHLIGKIS